MHVHPPFLLTQSKTHKLVARLQEAQAQACQIQPIKNNKKHKQLIKIHRNVRIVIIPQ